MHHTQNPEQRGGDQTTYCLRHPDTESNLRCGRCGDLICPRCLVTSPVGARCPNCARLGRPKILDTSSSELGRAILSAVVAAVGGAVMLSLVIWVVASLPFSLSLLNLLVVTGGIAGIGYLVGEAVRYGSGKKIDRRLKYVVAGGVFLAWISLAGFLPLFFNISAGVVSNGAGIVGLVAAFYVGIYRVRI